ncbi:unnamed protein product [Malus baccata var. baccata]
MGGCATKPKVSKGEAASEAPVPAPEPAAKEDQPAAVAASEAPVPAPEPAAKEDQAIAAVAVDDQEKEKEVVLVADSDEAEKKIEITPEPEPEEAQGGGDDKAKEIVDDDGQGSKRRSLSLLFKNVEGKEESTEPEKQLEPEEPLEEKTHHAPTDIAIEDASAASEKVAGAVTETADQATKEVKVAAAEEAK